MALLRLRPLIVSVFTSLTSSSIFSLKRTNIFSWTPSFSSSSEKIGSCCIYEPEAAINVESLLPDHNVSFNV